MYRPIILEKINSSIDFPLYSKLLVWFGCQYKELKVSCYLSTATICSTFLEVLTCSLLDFKHLN